MYHILPPERQRQYGSSGWNCEALPLLPADPPGLVELAVAVLAGIGGMEEEVGLPLATGGLDLFGAGEQRPRPRLEAEPVERRLAQRRFDAFGKVGRDAKLAGLERAGERRLQFAVRLRLLERRAADADPRAAARRLGADVGEDF